MLFLTKQQQGLEGLRKRKAAAKKKLEGNWPSRETECNQQLMLRSMKRQCAVCCRHVQILLVSQITEYLGWILKLIFEWLEGLL